MRGSRLVVRVLRRAIGVGFFDDEDEVSVLERARRDWRCGCWEGGRFAALTRETGFEDCGSGGCVDDSFV